MRLVDYCEPPVYSECVVLNVNLDLNLVPSWLMYFFDFRFGTRKVLVSYIVYTQSLTFQSVGVYNAYADCNKGSIHKFRFVVDALVLHSGGSGVSPTLYNPPFSLSPSLFYHMQNKARNGQGMQTRSATRTIHSLRKEVEEA